jgi:phosphoglucomutase
LRRFRPGRSPGRGPEHRACAKKTAVFREPGYLENYVQAVIDGVGGVAGHTIVVGGDGRFFNDTAIGIILLMLAANGAASAIVGQGGMMSTPAVSNLIRTRRAFAASSCRPAIIPAA